MLFEIFNGKAVSFPNLEEKNFETTLKELKPPKETPIALQNIMTQMWEKNRNKRPSAADLFEQVNSSKDEYLIKDIEKELKQAIDNKDPTQQEKILIELFKQAAQTPSKLEAIKKLLTQNPPPLKKLDLSPINPSDDTLSLLEKLESLEHLNLKNCTAWTEKGAQSIAKLKNLKTLDLSGCSQLTVETLKSLKNLNLTTLNLPDKITSRIYKEITLQNSKWEEVIENLNKNSETLKPTEKITLIQKETTHFEEQIYQLFQEKVDVLIQKEKTNFENKRKI